MPSTGENYHPILGSVFVTGFPHPYRWGMSEDEATDLALDELARKFKHEVLPHNIAAFPGRTGPGRGWLLPGATAVPADPARSGG